MATLAVLEGFGIPSRMKNQRGTPARLKASRRMPLYRKPRSMRPVDGIVYGEVDDLLGRSILKKLKNVGKSVAKVAVSPVTATYSVTKSAAKATVKAVKDPSLKNITAIVTKPATRAVGVVKETGREAGHAAAESGRAASTAASRSMGVIRRVAKRLIKGIAKKVLFKGDILGQEKPSIARMSKTAAKGLIMPTATALVAANTTTAPAAPLVPVLVNEVVDELYAVLERNVKKGMSPKDAEKAAKEALDKLEPGEENDPKVGVGDFTPWLIGGAAALALFLFLKRRN